jgi:adenine-specific DNA methylase
MIPKKCKRLAEVDFPIAEVSKHAAREKSIRHGHPSTLHLWWARRPLASSRAVLMALLLPDPCDAHCPEAFKKEARAALLAMDGRPQGWTQQIESDEGLRQVLLRFIADFANWDNAAAARYLETGRVLVHAAYPEEPPLVVDPFAGGGSIPLEALRLGCETFASDLNPVACLILKVMLEDIPCHGPKLAEELRRVGAEIKEKAERELADLYPKDPDGATPIAYLWAERRFRLCARSGYVRSRTASGRSCTRSYILRVPHRESSLRSSNRRVRLRCQPVR